MGAFCNFHETRPFGEVIASFLVGNKDTVAAQLPLVARLQDTSKSSVVKNCSGTITVETNAVYEHRSPRLDFSQLGSQ